MAYLCYMFSSPGISCLDVDLIVTPMDHWVFSYIKCYLICAFWVLFGVGFLFLFFSRAVKNCCRRVGLSRGGSEEEYKSFFNKKLS